MKYLFVAVPNKSGSTVIQNYLTKCKNILPLTYGRSIIEGQGILCERRCNSYPTSAEFRRVPHLWTKDLGKLLDENNYDWIGIRYEWEKSWKKWEQKRNPAFSVRMEKTPWNLFIIDKLQKNFSPAYFILSIRNPYVVCKSIQIAQKQKNKKWGIKDAAIHWMKCAKKQIKNIENVDSSLFFTYEEMTDTPQIVQEKIIKWMPELADFSFENKVSVHLVDKTKTNNLKNYNYLYLDKLENKEIEVINNVLEDEVMEYFGYERIL